MPLSLSDDEYIAVQAAAAPIHPLQRGAFLKALAEELERHPVVGPGVVHRCAADLQRRFGVEAQRSRPSRDTSSGRARRAVSRAPGLEFSARDGASPAALRVLCALMRAALDYFSLLSLIIGVQNANLWRSSSTYRPANSQACSNHSRSLSTPGEQIATA